ncbi:MAG: hypothetical protein IKS48_02895 [Eubacterium sp.]|nr:hypothetical protein [Eubacterium sp.]
MKGDKVVRKKVIGLGMILAMSAALYGCSGDAAGNTNTTIEETEETNVDVSEKDELIELADEKNDKSDTDENSIRKIRSIKKIEKKEVDETKSDTKSDDESNEETIKDTSTTESATKSSESNKAEEKSAEKPAESIADNPDVQHQIKVITTASDLWYHPDDASLKYMVTDFDHDGHFEITVGNIDKPHSIWEVNDENNGLVEIDTVRLRDISDDDSLPDIYTDGGYVTFGNNSEHVYIASYFDKLCKGDGTEVGDCEVVVGFKLNGNALEIERLAFKITENDTVKYNGPGDEYKVGPDIDEAEFNNSANNRYGADHDKYETQFHWTDLHSGDMNTELMNSYVAFHG